MPDTMTINDVFWNSWDRPYRHALMEAIASLGEIHSILEIGAHCGVNFRLWRSRWPKAALVGIDRHKAAVHFGREKWSHDPNVQFVNSDIRHLPDVPEADVISSCYALCYVPPEDLGQVLARLWSSTRLGLVLAEPMALDGLPLGPCADTPPEWRHAYELPLSEFALKAQSVSVQRIAPVDRMNAIATIRKAP